MKEVDDGKDDREHLGNEGVVEEQRRETDLRRKKEERD